MKATSNHSFKILLTVLFFSTVFLSCSIEKRHYRDGYYFHKSRQHQPSVESSALLKDEEGKIRRNKSQIVSADTLLQDTVFSSSASPKEEYAPRQKLAQHSFDRVNERVKPKSNHFPISKKAAPRPIEPNKEIGTWFGVMAAIFFIGGMLTLIAFGIGGPVVFVTALFFTCAVLCVVFASLYYPKAKSEPVTPEKAADDMNRTRLAIFSVPILFFIGLIVAVGWLLGGSWLF